MNAQLMVIEPESLEYIPAKTLLRVVEAAQNAKKWSAQFQATVNGNPALFTWLEANDLEVRFSLTDGDINLSFTGDGPRLGGVWGELRRAGYRPDCHPKKGDSQFYCHWRKDGFSTIWMNFSSTVCRRVQVGTKMVETPIYEVQCGELPEMLDQESKVPAVVGGDDDDQIPF